jgi:flagellar protein FlgJ
MDSTLTIAPDLLVQSQNAEQLGARAKVTGEQLTDAKRKQLKKISQDFESLFTGMMLKSMRATVSEDKLTGGGKAEETYRSMLDQEYATVAAKRGGTGSVASMVEKELLKRYSSPAQKKVAGTTGEEQ